MKKYASWLLISMGVIIIGIAAFQEISTIYNQKKLINDYNEHLNKLKSMERSELEAEILNEIHESDVITTSNEQSTGSSLQDTVNEETEDYSGQISNTETAPKKYIKSDQEKFFENKVISGLIEIPKIKVSAAILEGTDDNALKYAVGHYPGLGQPGEGNYVLLGHRNYVYGHFFRNLNDLEVGDKVIITKDSKTYTYVINESFVVKPEEVWVLEQTSDVIVTMITCTPIGTYTDRLIVRGAIEWLKLMAPF